MKLVFKKGEDSQIDVFLNVNGQEKEFSYIDMIKPLINLEEMEDPEISDGFSGAEIKSINSMITLINKEVTTTKTPASFV